MAGIGIVESGIRVAARPASERAFAAPLQHALDVRATSLEHGIDLDVRPRDVLAIARRGIDPTIPGLDAAQVDRLRMLVARAIEGQPVRVQSVVNAREAAYLLGGEHRMRTVYDAIGAGVDAQFYDATRLEASAAGRASRELELGLLGTGTTIYGRVRIGEVAHTPMVDPGAARTIRTRDRHLSVGPAQYGDVSLTLREAALDRSTFTFIDTGLVDAAEQVGAREQLPDVLARTIAHHFHSGPPGSSATASMDHPFGPFGHGDVRDHADLAAALRRLLDADDPHAVAALRQHLRSAAMDSCYAEAQVRVASSADIEHVSVRRPFTPAAGITDAATLERRLAYLRLQDDLLPAGAARGIGVHFDDGPLPRG